MVTGDWDFAHRDLEAAMLAMEVMMALGSITLEAFPCALEAAEILPQPEQAH